MRNSKNYPTKTRGRQCNFPGYLIFPIEEQMRVLSRPLGPHGDRAGRRRSPRKRFLRVVVLIFFEKMSGWNGTTLSLLLTNYVSKTFISMELLSGRDR
jgi:hypothetical protein